MQTESVQKQLKKVFLLAKLCSFEYKFTETKMYIKN